MLQVNFLKEHRDRVLEGLKKRNFKDLELVDSAISLDDERKKFSLLWTPSWLKSTKFLRK